MQNCPQRGLPLNLIWKKRIEIQQIGNENVRECLTWCWGGIYLKHVDDVFDDVIRLKNTPKESKAWQNIPSSLIYILKIQGVLCNSQ